MRLPRLLDSARRRRSISLPLNLQSPDFFLDPYPIYATLRKVGPAHLTTSGALLVVCHADVKACMTHPDLGNAPSRFSALAARHRKSRIAADVAGNIPPFQDRPAHIFSRRALSHAFSRRMSEFNKGLNQIAKIAVDRAPAECDLIKDISSPYSLDVMGSFIGLRDTSDHDLKSYSEAFFHLFAPLTNSETLAQTNAELSRFRDFAIKIIQERRATPREDLLSYLIEANIEGRHLDDTEVSDLALLVLADGIENVEAAAATVLTLLNDTARDTVLSSGAAEVVEEVLRLETPAQLVPRVALRDTEIAGLSVKSDHPVLLGLGSANRDPDVFSDPDTFLIDRDRSEVLTFGQGRHSCIGAPLARRMLIALTEALVQRKAHIRNPDSIVYAHRFGHRWPRGVGVSFA